LRKSFTGGDGYGWAGAKSKIKRVAKKREYPRGALTLTLGGTWSVGQGWGEVSKRNKQQREKKKKNYSGALGYSTQDAKTKKPLYKKARGSRGRNGTNVKQKRLRRKGHQSAGSKVTGHSISPKQGGQGTPNS